MTLFIAGLSPILWLLVALSVLKMPAYKACVVALVVAFFAASSFFGMTYEDTITAALEGTAMACWPILHVIIAAIFTYNLTVHTKAMDTIKEMLNSVSTDQRVIVLLIAWGFGGFLECMSGFGTAVAIGASMLASVGINPVTAVIVCLIANAIPSAYGSIGLPLTTLAQLTNFDPSLIATFNTLQIGILMILVPFMMVWAFGRSMSCLKGMVAICLVAGLGFFIPALVAGYFMGSGLAGVAGSIFSMGLTVAYAKMFPVDNPDYKIQLPEDRPVIDFKKGFTAWLPFILIFVLLMVTSKLVPPVHEFLSQFKTSLVIYTGETATPFTFTWIVTPGTLILFSAIVSGFVQKATAEDMAAVFVRTLKTLIPTFITIITIIGTARIMGYSGMTMQIAEVTVAATGTMYPFISPFIGSIGSFITGSATTSCVLFGKLQADSAMAIGASEMGQAWIAAANATGACVGKVISPQSVAIGVASVGILGGVESQIMKFAVRVYIPFIIIIGCVIYFGLAFVG